MPPKMKMTKRKIDDVEKSDDGPSKRPGTASAPTEGVSRPTAGDGLKGRPRDLLKQLATNNELQAWLDEANAKTAAYEKELEQLRPFRYLRPFPFLKLPEELRNRVYEYALPTGKTTHVFAIGKFDEDRPRYRHLSSAWDGFFCLRYDSQNPGDTNVLNANRQTRDEALAILLQKNAFVIEPEAAFFHFIGKDQFKNLRNLTIANKYTGYRSEPGASPNLGSRFMQFRLAQISKHWGVKHLTLRGQIPLESDDPWDKEFTSTNPYMDPYTDKPITPDEYVDRAGVRDWFRIEGLETCIIELDKWNMGYWNKIGDDFWLALEDFIGRRILGTT